MALNLEDLTKAILTAAVPILKRGGTEAKGYAEMESAKLALTLVSIGQLHAKGTINDAQAKALLDMQKNAAQAVLLSVEGIGILTAQRAINAALGAVATVVNKALGFTLLS